MQFPIVQKLKLIVLCLLAEGIYYILALVPVVPFTLLSAIFYPPTTALMIGATLFLVVVWAIQPDPIDDRDAMAVAPGSVLQQWVHALSAAVDGGRIHRIVLTDEVNASAYVSPGFMGLGARRTLRIGLPLLQCLSSHEVKAVVAHELGHFSRQHNRAGHWVYRVRYKWGIYLLAHRSDADGFIQSAQKLVARWFIPYFLHQSSAWSHQCEYEADACAQRAGLAGSLIDALVKVELHQHIEQHVMQQDWVQWKLQSDSPPPNILETTLEHIQRYAAPAFAPMLAAAQARPTRLYDTHPRLQQRADHLCVTIEPPQWHGVCAGAEAFPNDWASIFQAHQAAWVGKHRDAWYFAHYRLRWLQAQADAHPNDVALQAVAMASLSTSTTAVDALRALVADHPANAYLNYELGCALLDSDDEDGVDYLQAAVRLNKKMAVPALRRISEHRLQRDCAQAIERSIRKLDAALRWTDAFFDRDLWSRFANEPLEPLPAAARGLFRDAVRANPRIDGCWVGSLQSRPIDGHQFKINLVVFRMDGSGELSPHHTEDRMKAHMAHLLETVTRPDELTCVKAVFYTEPLNPRLLQNINKYPEVCIAQPLGALNQNVIRIDVL
ncbi:MULTISPECIES: M48 family metallopeptidase [unclassified Acidovorax]|uniref:M48 family metallopeptidase n=1 Tax=unclassified Acidovorax TaxID=2684926 RepID=UPI000A65DE01|nr:MULTISPECIES: M48 family metallopeptidase [unclassified Acidovorax]